MELRIPVMVGLSMVIDLLSLELALAVIGEGGGGLWESWEHCCCPE